MKTDRRILILTPTALPSVTGNAVTAERWRRCLEGRGLAVQVWPTEEKSPPALLEAIRLFRPNVIHIHHAYRAASLFLDPRVAAVGLGIPLVVSPAGTDIHLDWIAPEKQETVLGILQLARAIIVQNRATAQSLQAIRPDLVDRPVYVPKSVLWSGADPYDLRGLAGCRPGHLLFFLPAGIRPVKGNLECLLGMEKVLTLRPQVRMVFSGLALDQEYGARFGKEIHRLGSWARWVPTIPLPAMRSAYASADIVMNFSFAEGLSNALLEAIAAERPILASDIPGNRDPVLADHGGPPSGYLFDPRDPGDFQRQSLRLIDSEEEREALVRASRIRAARMPTPADEADGLIRAYEIARSDNKR